MGILTNFPPTCGVHRFARTWPCREENWGAPNRPPTVPSLNIRKRKLLMNENPEKKHVMHSADVHENHINQANHGGIYQ